MELIRDRDGGRNNTAGDAGLWFSTATSVINRRPLAAAMARFPEAEKRLLIKMICMNSFVLS